MINKYINPDAIEDGSIGKEKLAFAPAIESGYYSSMTVGEAENLVGRGESTKEEFSFRPSAGSLSIEDGSAKIASIKGNSVVYNQRHSTPYTIYSNVLQGDTFTYYHEANFESYTYADGVATFVGKPNLPSGLSIASRVDVGHKMLTIAKIKCSVADLLIAKARTKVNDNTGSYISTDWNEYAMIVDAPSGNWRAGMSVIVSIAKQNSHDGYTCEIKDIQQIDLTQMFGDGNEPTSYEEYLQRKPMNIADEFAYNAGTIVDMRVNEIKSVGDNAWDEEWENGTFNTTTGANNDAAKTQIRSKNLIKVLPNTKYTCTIPAKIGQDVIWCMLLDKDEKVIIPTGANYAISGNSFGLKQSAPSFTTPSNAAYLKFYCVTVYGDVYTNDICFHLEQSGYKNGQYFPYEQDVKDLSFISELFPNGMRSAGSVCDEIRYNKTTKKWEKVKRVDEVNLWQMNWVYDANKGRNRTNDSILNIKVPIGASTKANILNALYEAQSLDGTYLKNVGIAVDTTGRVWVYDDAYTGSEDVVAQFVSMLTQQKAVLYYELAVPEVTELDIDLTPYYEIWDFGTEEAIASEASTPFRADIIYQFNAVDRIRNNSTKIEELEQKTLFLTVKDDDHIVISNLDGQSKEFMPATPSGVPEHYTWLKYNGVTYGTFTGADGNTYGQEGKWGVYAERGGLADLSNEDMRQVVVDRRQLATNNNAVQSCILARTNLIANANALLISRYSFNSFLRASKKLEIANLILYSSSDAYFDPSNISQMFMGCTMLHTVLGTIDGSYLTNTTNCFTGCTALKDVRISGLKVSISFVDSPNLSYESVLYMVENSDSSITTDIIITLHSEAWDRIWEYDSSDDNPQSGALAEYLNNYDHIEIARG